MVAKPHFLLFCEGHHRPSAVEAATIGASIGSNRGRWRFILEDLEAGTRMEVADAELMSAPERAALLAVVRGLEALEQPSRVTLVTTSRYVARGLQFGLVEWRESDYCWEHFGSVQPIRNADLWRRVDHAMQFHQVHCRWIAGQESEEGEAATRIESEPMKALPRPSEATEGEHDHHRANPAPSSRISSAVHRAADAEENLLSWREWFVQTWKSPFRSVGLFRRSPDNLRKFIDSWSLAGFTKLFSIHTWSFECKRSYP